MALRRPNRARECNEVEGGAGGAGWRVGELLGVWSFRPSHVASRAALQLGRDDDVESGPRLLRLLVLLLWV